jgi:preprotein translocase subunit SecA
MNKQRVSIYEQRNAILDGKGVTDRIKSMIREAVEEQLDLNAPQDQASTLWNMEALNIFLRKTFGFAVEYSADELHGLIRPVLQEEVTKRVDEAYERRFADFAERNVDFAELQRVLLLQIMDHIWKNHLFELDHLKKGVGLRAYGQKDPLIEYQKESYILFEAMLGRVREQMVEYVFRIQLPPRPVARPVQQEGAPSEESGGGAPRLGGQPAAAQKPANKFIDAKTGRNDPCPCGSGKKYKKCHGANA